MGKDMKALLDAKKQEQEGRSTDDSISSDSDDKQVEVAKTHS